MNPFELTRALVDIESITSNEEKAGLYLFDYLSAMAREFDGVAERMDVEPGRFNVFARFGNPVVTLSTHMDTVPPFFASREDDEFIWGRAACDTKGIIASMIFAARKLLEAGTRELGLLFVVGEERNSAGAYHASRNPRGSRFLINGEPTENRLALGSKGSLRYEVIANGRMAHSAYPELGDSAIDKLLAVLARMREIEMPEDSLLGRSTLNIGVLSGGRAPNIIADEARAEILIRLVGGAESLKTAMKACEAPGVSAHEVLEIPALRLGSLPGFQTTVVAYTTDIPAFGGQWGQPFLLGPGSIHVAHTLEERIPKAQITEAVELYARIVKQLQNS
ncbi:MAG: M20/M25/M40 family metallo-hydrolase [Acidobacteriota bacterium]|nr:M20/M25/M40 family metallo-hydrolase [Acidobacteriota bacterium]